MVGNFSGEKELQRLLAAKFNKAQKNKVEYQALDAQFKLGLAQVQAGAKLLQARGELGAPLLRAAEQRARGGLALGLPRVCRRPAPSVSLVSQARLDRFVGY